MSLIKVAWYVLRVKNVHFGSPSDLPGLLGESKLIYIHYNIRQGVAEPCLSKLTLVFHHIPRVLVPTGCMRLMYLKSGYFPIKYYLQKMTAAIGLNYEQDNSFDLV